MKKTFKISYLFSLSFLIASTVFAQGRKEINLNKDWLFIPGYEVSKSAGTIISLPHTWNLDAMSGKLDYYRGNGDYSKTIKVPDNWKDSIVFLRVGAANQAATVQVNGKTIGEHFGGYTAFGFDLSKYLNFGKENTLTIRVSNANDLGIMPLVGDFNFYGGIYRDVKLQILPQNHISVNHYASNGIRIIQKEVNQKSASFVIQARVKGSGKLKVDIKDDKGKVLLSDSKKIASSDESLVEIPFHLKNPRLWNGRVDPYRYQADIRFEDDRVVENFGLRYYQVDDENQFWLNGEKLQIHGVGRHQDFGNVGNAISKTHMENDVEVMLEMGVNAVRLTHYPHDPYFMELCDRAGIIVWSEIPFVGPGGYRGKGFVDTERFKENGKQQLAEMIEQLYNHPSVFFWGLFNELVEIGDDPVPYLKALNEQAKNDDPTRLTVAASMVGGGMDRITDLIGFNRYHGWYGGKTEELDTWTSDMQKKYPELKMSISEYGAGASIHQQQENLTPTDPNSRWHPENWQTKFHEDYWRIINEKKYFWGTFVWAMFDLYSAHRTEGERNGINDKGLVGIDHKTKKDAFYFYKANWNEKDKFIYMAEKRNDIRRKRSQDIKVFSNLNKVVLFLNGEKIGERANDGYGIFEWNNILLKKGKNTIKVFSLDEKFQDVTELYLQ